MKRLYLDIDGVLLTKKNAKQADNLEEFIDFALANYYCYWLTTHCKGDSIPAINYLSKFTNDTLLNKLRKIKPTNWDMLKTEGIDFSTDFYWLDDYPFQAELNYLKDHGLLERFILVDLTNANELLRIISILQ